MLRIQLHDSLKLQNDEVDYCSNSQEALDHVNQKVLDYKEAIEHEVAMSNDVVKDMYEVIILDFIAGMTDSFAVRSFEELFVPKATV